MIDLHTHSSASDGSCSPKELIELAARLGVETIALTDHDTIDGIEEAEKSASEKNIRLIHGVELEIEWTRGEFHLLGLGLKTPSESFLSLLKEFSEIRLNRNLIMLDKMNRMFGLTASYDDIRALAGGNPFSIGRPHFAAYLIRHHKIKNMNAAFKRYLGFGQPLYVKKTGVNFEKAVLAIHESGGIAVAAHPNTLYVANSKIREVFVDLKERALDGIEAWHPNASLSECKRYEEIANELDLCITAGSDFHGELRKDRRLGFTACGQKIEERFLPEALKC